MRGSYGAALCEVSRGQLQDRAMLGGIASKLQGMA